MFEDIYSRKIVGYEVHGQKCDELGVTASLSRPRVSNDNPYSEALFRTLKYRPQWPRSGFKSLIEARKWVEVFVIWYNEHSKLNFVSPGKCDAR